MQSGPVTWRGLRIKRTRYEFMGYVRLDASTWQNVRLIDGEEPAQVGPHYRTEKELLSDLDRYVQEQWTPVAEALAPQGRGR